VTVKLEKKDLLTNQQTSLAYSSIDDSKFPQFDYTEVIIFLIIKGAINLFVILPLAGNFSQLKN